MAKLLDQALERLRGLSEDKQESYARLLLHEIDTDEAFEASSAARPEALKRLVEEVLAADERGETEILDPDTL
jgi:hypothetical protein